MRTGRRRATFAVNVARRAAPTRVILGPMDDLQARLAAAVEELATSVDPRVQRLAALLREAADVVDEIDGERAMHEAAQARLEAQRELIAALGCPVLRLRSDVLCVPLIGPYDVDRTTQLSEAVLAAVAGSRVRLVVFDLTGAYMPEPSSAEHVASLCAAVRLLGARAALTGIQPALARMLAATPLALRDVAIHLSLESALQAAPP